MGCQHHLVKPLSLATARLDEHVIGVARDRIDRRAQPQPRAERSRQRFHIPSGPPANRPPARPTAEREHAVVIEELHHKARRKAPHLTGIGRPHRRGLWDDQPLEILVVEVIEDDEPRVDVMRLVRSVHPDRVRMPARIGIRLEHGDVMCSVQQVRHHQPRDPGTNHSNPHLNDQPPAARCHSVHHGGRAQADGQDRGLGRRLPAVSVSPLHYEGRLSRAGGSYRQHRLARPHRLACRHRHLGA